jgi:hypothetical protein
VPESIRFIHPTTLTPVGTKVRRRFDGATGTIVAVYPASENAPANVAVDLGRSADDVWSGTLEAWELVTPREYPAAGASEISR